MSAVTLASTFFNCSICEKPAHVEGEKDIIHAKCNHIFHQTCYLKKFSQSDSNGCPQCQKVISAARVSVNRVPEEVKGGFDSVAAPVDSVISVVPPNEVVVHASSRLERIQACYNACNEWQNNLTGPQRCVGFLLSIGVFIAVISLVWAIDTDRI
jgi:hypothetical protein